MYKIALIDDEDIVREGMKDLIPWKELGLELVGDSEDGEDALELIKTLRPHIILLDINMPRINGLELAKIVRETYPEIKIVFITGYDEFSYVKSALKIGVEDYVLKPISKLEMIEILNKIVMKIDHEKKQQEEVKSILNRVKQSIPLIQQKCLEEILFEGIEMSILGRRCEQANIPWKKRNYGIILLQNDNKIEGSNGENLTYFAIQNIVRELIEEQISGILFEDEDKIGVLYYSDDEIKDREEKYLNTIGQIKESIAQHIGVTVTIGAGKLVENISEIKYAYQGAKQVLVSSFFGRKEQIILEEVDTGKENIVSIQTRIKWENQLIETIQKGIVITTVTEEICNQMKELHLSIEGCHSIWEGLVGNLLKKFVQIDETVVHIFNTPINIEEEMRTRKTLLEIKDWVDKLYMNCLNYIENQSSPNKNQIKEAMNFIEKNFHRTELSMKMVCDHIHLSPSYFSSIFKKETGLTFVQVVTEHRMEKSKELLLYSMFKTYEIAEQVGFTDPHYFSSAFKKQFGISPSEYRKQYQVKQDE